jgi:flagellin
LVTHQTINPGSVETGTQLAYALAGNTGTSTTLKINGQTGSVTAVNLTGAAAGTYQITQGTTGAPTSTTYTSGSLAGSTATRGYTFALSPALSSLTYTGSGSGATLIVTESTGTITGVTITGGSGYKDGDVLQIASSALGGTSTGTTNFTLGGTVSDSLLMTGTVNGIATTQQVTVAQNNAGAKQTINFSSFGIAFDVTSNQQQTGNDISTKIVAANGGTPSTAGQFVVAQGVNSNLQFQSGPNSSAFIGINTANVLTGSSGTYVGNQSAMTNVGTVISATGAGNLGGLQASDSTATWQAAFQKAAGYIDQAVDYISTIRTTYGSQMNRLSYISTNLTAQSTNLQQSKSAIMDTNFASETATLTKGQIMQQAATAMLAQANQMPNVILSLLK